MWGWLIVRWANSTPFHRKVGRWRYKHALPAVWMCLSSVMLPMHTVQMILLCGLVVRDSITVEFTLQHNVSSATIPIRMPKFVTRLKLDWCEVGKEMFGQLSTFKPAKHQSRAGKRELCSVRRELPLPPDKTSVKLSESTLSARLPRIRHTRNWEMFDGCQATYPSEVNVHPLLDVTFLREVDLFSDENSPFSSPFGFYFAEKDYWLPKFNLSLTSERPRAYNARTPHSLFDQDFVASLQSEQNSGNGSVVTIILNTGASISTTFDRQDFVELRETDDLGTLSTAGGPTAIQGVGKVRWRVISMDGMEADLELPAYFVPTGNQRLLSPQDFCLFHRFRKEEDHFGGNSSYFWMTVDERSHVKFQCPIDPRSNLPIALARISAKKGLHQQGERRCQCGMYCHESPLQTHLSVADETNQNLTAAQKELLLWHWRLGHRDFQSLKDLFRPREAQPNSDSVPNLPSECLTSKVDVLKAHVPLCAACQLANAHRRGAGTTTTKIKPQKENILKWDDIVPGQRVSIDHYESSVRGRLRQSKGRESLGQRYVGGTIFADHASGLVRVFHQVSLRTSDTIRSKRLFERFARGCQREVESYHADNGSSFQSKEMQDELEKHDQVMNFSGVGAKFQNGIAERNIRTVVEMARAMMQHAFLHWSIKIFGHLPWIMRVGFKIILPIDEVVLLRLKFSVGQSMAVLNWRELKFGDVLFLSLTRSYKTERRSLSGILSLSWDSSLASRWNILPPSHLFVMSEPEVSHHSFTRSSTKSLRPLRTRVKNYKLKTCGLTYSRRVVIFILKNLHRMMMFKSTSRTIACTNGGRTTNVMQSNVDVNRKRR